MNQRLVDFHRSLFRCKVMSPSCLNGFYDCYSFICRNYEGILTELHTFLGDGFDWKTQLDEFEKWERRNVQASDSEVFPVEHYYRKCKIDDVELHVYRLFEIEQNYAADVRTIEYIDDSFNVNKIVVTNEHDVFQGSVTCFPHTNEQTTCTVTALYRDLPTILDALDCLTYNDVLRVDNWKLSEGPIGL